MMILPILLQELAFYFPDRGDVKQEFPEFPYESAYLLDSVLSHSSLLLPCMGAVLVGSSLSLFPAQPAFLGIMNLLTGSQHFSASIFVFSNSLLTCCYQHLNILKHVQSYCTNSASLFSIMHLDSTLLSPPRKVVLLRLLSYSTCGSPFLVHFSLVAVSHTDVSTYLPR